MLHTDTAKQYVTFESKSEYACAKLLESFTPWRLEVGKTFQIQLGRCRFDFRVGDTFIEYHPINLKHEFLTDCFKEMLSILSHVNKGKREAFFETLSDEFAAQYFRRRSQILAASEYKHCNLLVVTDPLAFIRAAIVPNMRMPDPPGKDELLTRFHAFLKDF